MEGMKYGTFHLINAGILSPDKTLLFLGKVLLIYSECAKLYTKGEMIPRALCKHIFKEKIIYIV